MTGWAIGLWIATTGVIVGVALEEYEFVCKVFRCTLRYGPPGLWRFAKRKGWRKSAHHVGFILLVVCLAAELVLQAKVEIDSDGKLGVAEANAASANRDAEQAKLRIEELKSKVGPRVIDRDKFLAALKGKRSDKKVKIVYASGLADGFTTGLQLGNLLHEAGWTCDGNPESIPKDSVYDVSSPLSFSETEGDHPEYDLGSGITILSGFDDMGFDSAAQALGGALFVSLGTTPVSGTKGLPEGTIVVVIEARA